MKAHWFSGIDRKLIKICGSKTTESEFTLSTNLGDVSHDLSFLTTSTAPQGAKVDKPSLNTDWLNSSAQVLLWNFQSLVNKLN